MRTLKASIIFAIVGFMFAAAVYSQTATDRYIVALRSQTANPGAVAAQIAREHGIKIGAVYSHSLRGFMFAGPPQAAQAIARRMEVAYVEPDQLFYAIDLPTGIDRADVETKVSIDGLGGDLLNSQVRVAVLDTGVDRDHPDLNVSGGIRFYSIAGIFLRSDDQFDDGNGHGTHVSGTIGAKDNGVDLNYGGNDYEVVGVAPGVPIYAVKVLDDNGSGYTSAIIAGVDHVADNADTIQVANMSLGGGFSQALNDAVAGAVSAGVVFVVAAGNNNNDASQHSPASEPTAITVSALADNDGLPGGIGGSTSYGPDDSLATFSNYGQLIDICAPGVSILSTLPGGYGFGSGTSMASPHVAGAAALYIANASDPYSGINRLIEGFAAVQVVRNTLVTAGWHAGDPEYFSGDRDIYPEALLNVGGLALNGTEPNAPPVASSGGPYTGTEDVAVTFSGSASDADGDTLTYAWDFGDGSTALGQTVYHSYLWGGTFAVTLTVTDGRGGSDTATTTATIGEVNDVPLANAGGPYNGNINTAITFDGTGSHDYDNEDGTTENDQALTYSWDFGDGGGATGPNPTHIYSSVGSFTVTLTISDGTASACSTSSVTITNASPIALTVTKRVLRKGSYADLKWSGATGKTVGIYRNGALLKEVKNTGSYSDPIAAKGTYRYQILAENGSSNEVEVTF